MKAKYEVGSTYKNNKDEEYKILEKTLRKDYGKFKSYSFKICFLDSGVEKVVSDTSIKRGEVSNNPETRIMHRKYEVGNIYTNKKGEEFELLERVGKRQIRVRFVGTKLEKTIFSSSIAQGKISSFTKADTKNLVGLIKENRDGKQYEILESIKLTGATGNTRYKYRVRFLSSGTEKVVCSNSIYNGSIKDGDIHKFVVGETYENSEGDKYKILDIKRQKGRSRARICHICFLSTGYETDALSSNLSCGRVANKGLDFYNIGVGSIIETLSGPAKVIGMRQKGATRNDAFYDIEFLRSNNVVRGITKHVLNSGVVFDVTHAERTSVGLSKKKYDPHHYILFRYEYEAISEIASHRGEGFIIGAMKVFFKNDALEFDYIDTLKFDKFKAFYRYLIVMDATIK